MPSYIGKRTARLPLPLQLRCDPELAEAIRFLARANRRSIGLQILHWIEQGVENEKGLLSQPPSLPVTSVPQSAVTNRHSASRKNVA